MRTRMKNPTTRPIPVAVRRRSFHEPPTPAQTLHAENLLMGNVKILKRGEPLTAFLPPRSDLSPYKNLETASTTRSVLGDLSFGPDPETVKKGLPTTISGKGFAAGGCVTSPHPSLVPVPGFLSGAEIATHGLRRLMGVGLA